MIVYDSSSLISLAKGGLLQLIGRLPIGPVILDVVEEEAVTAAVTRGHADAAAIGEAIAGFPRRAADPDLAPDAAILSEARAVGTLIANDLALGRRARNLGVKWLRTADLLVLGARTGVMSDDEARDGIRALHDAGRLSPELATEYLEEFG